MTFCLYKLYKLHGFMDTKPHNVYHNILHSEVYHMQYKMVYNKDILHVIYYGKWQGHYYM